MRGYRTTCTIPLFYCSRCLVYNSQTTLNAKVRHSQPDYDRLPIFKKKKKKIRLGRIKRAGGVAQGAGHSVSQSTNGRVARQQQLHDARRYVAATELLPMDFSGPCDEMMCWRWLCYWNLLLSTLCIESSNLTHPFFGLPSQIESEIKLEGTHHLPKKRKHEIRFLNVFQ